MKSDDFLIILEELQETEKHINETKGKEYAQGDEDALRNFKEAGRFLGLTAKQICGVYLYKHFAAIMSYSQDGHVRSESLCARVCDLRLYAALMLALDEEEQYEG